MQSPARPLQLPGPPAAAASATAAETGAAAAAASAAVVAVTAIAEAAAATAAAATAAEQKCEISKPLFYCVEITRSRRQRSAPQWGLGFRV